VKYCGFIECSAGKNPEHSRRSSTHDPTSRHARQCNSEYLPGSEVA
jgi:hypothetical protein